MGIELTPFQGRSSDRALSRIEAATFVEAHRAKAESVIDELKAQIRERQMGNRLVSYAELATLASGLSGGDAKLENDLMGMVRGWADLEGEIFRRRHGL